MGRVLRWPHRTTEAHVPSFTLGLAALIVAYTHCTDGHASERWLDAGFVTGFGAPASSAQIPRISSAQPYWRRTASLAAEPPSAGISLACGIAVGAAALWLCRRNPQPSSIGWCVPQASEPSTFTSSLAVSLPMVSLSVVNPRDEGLVIMYRRGGRRKALGLGGWTCMLTGKRKKRGYYRTFCETKVYRSWKPNLHWKKLWWKEEQKWVRLRVSTTAIKLVDRLGLEKMAELAGIDLYAWSLPHWVPGSRQPISAKVGHTARAKNDLKFWPDYEPHLNKGKPLAEVVGLPPRKEKWSAWKNVLSIQKQIWEEANQPVERPPAGNIKVALPNLKVNEFEERE